MDKIKGIHYVLSELMHQYDKGIAVTDKFITELAAEYDVEVFVPEITAIANKLMPIGAIGSVEYPFNDDSDIA